MAQQAERELGLLEDQADVGKVSHAGSATYDPASRVYAVTGGGANMWFAQDDFHFAWKKVSSDVTLAAEIAFVGPGKNPHRKACLIIRQGLEPGAAYVDVAVHGDGLTSLQFRDTKGETTHEVQTNVSRPRRVQLVQRGQDLLLFVAEADGPWKFSGAAVRMTFSGTRYAGIGVCGHDDSLTETASFSHLAIEETAKPSADKPTLYSTLETQSLASTDRRVVHVAQGRIEAPNWLRDGKTLIYNSGGRIYRILATGGQPEVIDTGFAKRCNNDHGVSPDGTRLVISDQSQPDGKSRIYSLPVVGGEPTLITPQGPSYWHGWSPDGKTFAYCAERNGEFDVYKIAAAGGPEQRLTTAKGLDDGPEFSPDGNLIYFNSDRTGQMQIWQMKPDGADQQQMTNDSLNNWFPHPSPDGRFLVFLSYEHDVAGHPEDKDVTLRRMSLSSRKIDVLGRFLGGQGTINVPCWSPDGRQIAFVTYQRIM